MSKSIFPLKFKFDCESKLFELPCGEPSFEPVFVFKNDFGSFGDWLFNLTGLSVSLTSLIARERDY